MASRMLGFVTNDNVTIRYSDTGHGKPWKWHKDPLILVCSRLLHYLSPPVFSFCYDASSLPHWLFLVSFFLVEPSGLITTLLVHGT
jgi:hypothetical protein